MSDRIRGTLESKEKNGEHGKHGGMHMLACVLMVVVAGVLLLAGAGAGSIAVLLVLCALMMVAMMWTMRGQGH